MRVKTFLGQTHLGRNNILSTMWVKFIWDFLLIDLILSKKVPLKLNQTTSANLLALNPTSEIRVGGIGWYFAGIYHTNSGEKSTSLLMRKRGMSTKSYCIKNTNHQVPVKTIPAVTVTVSSWDIIHLMQSKPASGRPGVTLRSFWRIKLSHKP